MTNWGLTLPPLGGHSPIQPGRADPFREFGMAMIMIVGVRRRF